MTLVKDSKSSKTPKSKPDKSKLTKRSQPCDDTVEVEGVTETLVRPDDVGCGPSSGVKLTNAEREANLCELLRLQRLLMNLQLDEDE